MTEIGYFLSSEEHGFKQLAEQAQMASDVGIGSVWMSLARDLEISESCLRNWIAKPDIEEGRRDGVTAADRVETVACGARSATRDGKRSAAPRGSVFCSGQHLPKMMYAFIADRCGDLPAAVTCRTMKVSSSGLYEWRHHRMHPRPRIREDQLSTAKIGEIHQMSRGTYGSPRVRAELRLGEGIRCSRKRLERLMRQGQLVGLHKRRKTAQPDAIRPRRRLRISSSGSSMSTPRTGCGSPRSPSTPPVKERCSSPR